ncbi:MAG: CDP-alcohol phosphatidyltransferase family protein [candidate division WOR-3 bacterium]
MKEESKRRGRRLLRPLVNLLVTARVTPCAVTLAAVPLALGASVLLALGRFVWAGILLALVGLCDTLDGGLSRLTGRATSSGAFLDSVVDRFGELVAFIGLFWYYQSVNRWYALVVLFALVCSFMVSYVRARAEGAGYECRVGWFERPVRVLVLLFGLFILGRTWTPLALAVIAAGSFGTVIHRLVHVLGQARPHDC